MAMLAVHDLPRVRISRPSRGPLASALMLIDDPWLAATLLAAVCASVISWYIAFQNHTILLYRDAHSHLDIARRVVDASSTGLAQLGGVWLPLPHLVMLPFIWNDYLWRSGLAGSFTSMIAYVITAVFLYRTAFRLTSDQRASFLGALVFILNPNILYLQATPLSEMVLLASMTAAGYYFVTWAKDGNTRHLIFAAVCTFLATMARYDGWALFLICLVLIGIIGWRKKLPRRQVQGNMFLYALPGVLGIGLWMLWCLVIFHDPLYFQHSEYSAQAQQKFFIDNHLDWTYHNLWQSIHDYLVLSLETVGPLLFVVALAGLIAFIFRSKLSPEMLASLAFLVPFPFYIAAMFGGQAIMFAPGAASPAVNDVWFNDRYGAGVVLPMALYAAALVMRWPWGKIGLLALILAQSFLIAQGGIVTLQDGQVGLSCNPYSVIPDYLRRHYDTGYILDDTYNTATDFRAVPEITLSNVIYQGSGAKWHQALRDPASIVNWIIVASGDQVSQAIDVHSEAFNAQYEVVAIDYHSGAVLYHKRGLPPLPTRLITIDPDANAYRLCGTIPLFNVPTTSTVPHAPAGRQAAVVRDIKHVHRADAR